MEKGELCKKVVEVWMVSDSVMTVVVVFEEDVQRFICGYAPQKRSLEEKQSLYDELKCEWDIHSTDDIVMCLGDFNGQVGGHIGGFDGWYGVGQRKLEGRMSLEP